MARRSGRAALAALAATVVCAGASGEAVAAGGWVPGPVHGDGRIAGYSDLAISPDGGTTTAWTMPPENGGGATAYAQRTPAGGVPAPAVEVSPPGVASIVASVAATASGTTLVLALDYRELAIRLTTLAADGSVTASRIVAGGLDSPLDDGIALAADDDGDALVTWVAEDPDGDARLYARRIAADGTAGTLLNLAEGGEETEAQAAFAPDGSARVVWVDAGDATPRVSGVRLSADGERDGAVETISSTGGAASAPSLSTSAAGVVASWIEFADDAHALRVAPLPGSGPVAGASQPIAADVMSSSPQSAASVLLADDGSLTAAWSGLDATRTALTQWMRTLSPSGALGPVFALSGPTPANRFDQWPRLVRGVGGERYAFWVRRAPGGSVHDELQGRSIAADGTLGPVTSVTSTLVPANVPVYTAGSDAAGDLAVGWLNRRGVEETLLIDWATATLDRSGPLVTADATGSARVGEPASFSASASDRSGIVGYRWQFGDGAGADGPAATHAYAAAGSYEASVTVTDGAGHTTVVRRTVTVLPALAATTPDPDPRLPGTGLTPVTPPVDGDRTGPGGRAKAPAALRIARVTRRGARVTIAGRLDRRASGRVAVTWQQRAGRRTVTRTVRVRIARGRFTATLRLPPTLATARTRARLTVSYKGNATTRAAKISRIVAGRR